MTPEEFAYLQFLLSQGYLSPSLVGLGLAPGGDGGEVSTDENRTLTFNRNMNSYLADAVTGMLAGPQAFDRAQFAPTVEREEVQLPELDTLRAGLRAAEGTVERFLAEEIVRTGSAQQAMGALQTFINSPTDDPQIAAEQENMRMALTTTPITDFGAVGEPVVDFSLAQNIAQDYAKAMAVAESAPSRYDDVEVEDFGDGLTLPTRAFTITETDSPMTQKFRELGLPSPFEEYELTQVAGLEGVQPELDRLQDNIRLEGAREADEIARQRAYIERIMPRIESRIGQDVARDEAMERSGGSPQTAPHLGYPTRDQIIAATGGSFVEGLGTTAEDYLLNTGDGSVPVEQTATPEPQPPAARELGDNAWIAEVVRRATTPRPEVTLSDPLRTGDYDIGSFSEFPRSPAAPSGPFRNRPLPGRDGATFGGFTSAADDDEGGGFAAAMDNIRRYVVDTAPTGSTGVSGRKRNAAHEAYKKFNKRRQEAGVGSKEYNDAFLNVLLARESGRTPLSDTLAARRAQGFAAGIPQGMPMGY